MADDWRIHKDREGCQKPGCPLPTCRSYFAVLEWQRVDSGKAGKAGTDADATVCVRRELCDACFADHERRCGPEQPPIFWRAVRRQSGSKEPVLDLVSLRALFDRLAEVDDERARALRYFCALLLLRKRVLKMKRPTTREQEQADLVVVDPKQKDRVPILLFAPPVESLDLGGIKDELLAAIGETADAADPAEAAGET